MEIFSLALGDFETNCYVVRAGRQAKECLIIDPGFSAEGLLEFLNKEGLSVERILLTHGHCDHIAGVKLLREHYNGVPVAISGEDAQMLTSGRKNLAWMTGSLLRVGEPDEILNAGQEVGLEQVKFKVLSTPGHTPGGMSFYSADQGVVFSGDTLFSGSIGRDDFSGGNRGVLLQSIREQLFVLPEETVVYPGHGPATTIGREKQSNPFF
jgi:glyoxylase-like metal-dependent hydrolase (beta-lactamase superfamily II)